MKSYKGYIPSISFSVEDNEFVGIVEGARDIIHFSGTSVAELEAAFREMVDQYLDWCARDGVEPEKPYSGKLAFRTTPEHHRLISQAASQNACSINQWMDETLTRAAEQIIADGNVKIPLR